MHIILNHSSMVPIYEQLMEQIKTGIIESALAEGEALPSVRKLAGELRISALKAKNVGLSNDEILEIVTLLLDEA